MDGQKNDSELILLSLCQPAYAADTEATEAQFMNDHPEYSGFLLVSYIYHILYIWSKMFIVLWILPTTISFVNFMTINMLA